ncbi:hypothetical protein WJX72_008592 [[Myrmecia] bisecta]|uniref:DUF4200 domain-containing protein n=1 Tax=[Myrmecia] bisecta TaxID=41462 RepID=A0AAW1QRK4_9CHLO
MASLNRSSSIASDASKLQTQLSQTFSTAHLGGTKHPHDPPTSSTMNTTLPAPTHEPDPLVNPFVLPNDEEIFMLQEEEKRRKQALIMSLKSLPVHLKPTFCSQIQATVARDAGGVKHSSSKLVKRDPARELSAAAMTLAPDHRRPEKENMTEFIAKKREIFLVQMSLDTKRAEITKLEERALQREEALKKSEQMLEEDALRFDAFLKENDEKVQEAIKKAEVEAKAKQDKVLEIKRLNAAMAVIRSELNKYEEQLEDCKKYKAFLDKITPHEWFAERLQERDKKRKEREERWQAECKAVRKQKQDAKDAKAKAEHDYANARTQQEAERAEQAIQDSTAALKEILRMKEPPPPADVEEEDTEQAMYFQHPKTLLVIFGQLEEQNLFLIQNAQETEEALEELRAKQRDTRARMDADSEGLKLQIEQLQAAILASSEKCRLLKERAQQNFEGAMGISSHDVTLDQLASKIAEVYERCGFDRDASMSTLQMLTNIETKLEEYLSVTDLMPAELVEAAEKAREKERRSVAREDKILQQKSEHEARVKRALERAAAPVFKKTGKPVMFRSQPLRKKVVVEVDRNNDEEAELEEFLAQPRKLEKAAVAAAAAAVLLNGAPAFAGSLSDKLPDSSPPVNPELFTRDLGEGRKLQPDRDQLKDTVGRTPAPTPFANSERGTPDVKAEGQALPGIAQTLGKPASGTGGN